MKKVIYALTVCMSTLIITGCSKEDQGLENIEDTTLQKIQQLTSDFINSQDKVTDNTKAIDPAVAEVDIRAGIESYNNDSSDMTSVFADAIAASGLASKGIANPNPGNGADNSSNPLDYAGKYHVDILHYQLTQKNNYVWPNGVFNYDHSAQTTRNMLSIYGENVNQSNSNTANTFQVYYDQLVQELESVNYLLSQSILIMRNQGKITALESQVLYAYFAMQESASSLTSYIQYSKQIEQLIVDSNYPSKTKDFLLFTMATARHDFHYWNRN